MEKNIKKRESTALINSLNSGVVPRVGLKHIAVGRKKEINALMQDLKNIEDGGASFRLIAGHYGSGKSFLLQFIRSAAMDEGFIVADADLSPERRLTGTKGQGLATYRELMQNISNKSRPDGGALESIMQKWIINLQNKIAKEKSLLQTSPEVINLVSIEIKTLLSELSEMSYGFAFASVVESYWKAVKTGDDELKESVIRWLRGEFATKTEAKKVLPVDCIIDDQTWYEFLKLMSLFVVKAGYKGLIIFMDEGVNLYKIANKQSRESNYEKLLTIFNDTMQGKAQHIGVILSGTPKFVEDERRGLYSYEALKSRLIDNKYALQGYIDYNSPVLKLSVLSNDETRNLLEKLIYLHASHFNYEIQIGMNEVNRFINLKQEKLGSDTLLTPREITRDFLSVLSILNQHPDADFDSLINSQSDYEEVKVETKEDNSFAEFTL